MDNHTTAHATASAAAQRDLPLVLASASPRRRELLALLNDTFEVVSTDAEERDDPVPDAILALLPAFALAIMQHPALLAWRKAQAVAAVRPNAVVLGGDTIVVLGDAVLNKPRDAAHACTMLAALAGQTHTVYTGLCVTLPHGRPEQRRWLFDLVASDVAVAPLSDAEIRAYVDTGEPLDKAGAYGIQGLGGKLVQRVTGSYTAVVGLPLVATAHLLRTAGVTQLNEPEHAYRAWLHNQGKEPLPCIFTLP